MNIGDAPVEHPSVTTAKVDNNFVSDVFVTATVVRTKSAYTVMLYENAQALRNPLRGVYF